MPPLSDVVVAVTSGGMLALGFADPRGGIEAAVAVLCAVATRATGLLTFAESRGSVHHPAPVEALLSLDVTVVLLTPVVPLAPPISVGAAVVALRLVARGG